MMLDRGEWSVAYSCDFTPGERAPSNHQIGVEVVPRAGLDILWREKFLPPTGTMFILFEVGMGLLQLSVQILSFLQQCS